MEEKQDWYRVLEDAVYHPEAFQFDPEHSSNVIRPLIRRKRPLLNFMHQYDTTHDITLQKVSSAYCLHLDMVVLYVH